MPAMAAGAEKMETPGEVLIQKLSLLKNKQEQMVMLLLHDWKYSLHWVILQRSYKQA